MPKFKHQQTPQFARVVAAATEMFLENGRQRLLVKISSLNRARLEQQLCEILFEFVSDPMNHRHGKSLLGTIQDLRRDTNPRGQFLENVLLIYAPHFPMCV